MINILIVDDHQLFAEGLKSMFNPKDEITVVGQTTNGYEVPKLLNELEVDVVLMDIDMPQIDGIATLELMKKEGFDLPVLMLTMHQSLKYIRKALEKGAQGYILKAASKKEVVDAIETVNQRKNYFHEKVSEQVFDYFRGKRSNDTTAQELSTRELEIVKCLAEGLNSKQVGEKLFISQQTVRTHRRNIMHKLHVKTTGELIRLSMEKGWIED
ncbi:MAG: response regulator transcription factor [Cytophagales bacterium]|nr:response regulator transcription factor [Cytophagales bacterium]